MSKIKNILIGGIASIALGALPLLLTINGQYQKAEAVNIDMSGYTRITSTNLNLLSEGSQVYMVEADSFQGVDMSAGTHKTSSKASLTPITVNEVKDNTLALSYNGGYLSLTQTTNISFSSVAKTYVDVDSDGYVSYSGEYKYTLAYTNGRVFAFEVDGQILTPKASNVVALFVLPKSEMSAMNQLAYTILNEVGCDSDGVVAPSSSDWSNIQTAYNALSDAEKLSIKTYAASEGDVDVVKSAMAKYDYIMSKYKNRTTYPNYLERSEGSLSGLFDGTATDVVTFSRDNTAAIIVTISAAILSATVVSYFVIRKKKQD